MKRILAAALMLLAGCAPGRITPQEARVIARDAYVYGYPLVDNYRIQFAYFVDRGGPEYKGEWNEIHNTARVYTPEDKAIQTPNSDTPYSMLGADLRAEPVVITVPAIEPRRYYSLQFIDAYTHNFAYAGSRTTGNEAASFLLAGPDWSGATPPGIQQVFHCETYFAFVIFRTQLFEPADLENVKQIQAGYRVQPLSKFLGKTPSPEASDLTWIVPPGAEVQRTSPEFFETLNFALQYCPVHPSEQELRGRLARLGIGVEGRWFDVTKVDPAILAAMREGIQDAWAIADSVNAEVTAGKVTSGDLFGTREYLKNNYARRMIGAVAGIYGNSKDEAIYPAYRVDSAGAPLTGTHRYRLRFAPGQLPPVNAFWSLTMYEMPASLLYANPLNRYLINSPMLPKLKQDADGGITLYIQHASPGAVRESNWLPAPKGPFGLILRMYWPKPEAATWKQPPLERVN